MRSYSTCEPFLRKALARCIDLHAHCVGPSQFILASAGAAWSSSTHLPLSSPPSTLWLLVAGGVAYSSGVIFHLWERLKFHNVLWHCFVVLGATLHLWAILTGFLYAH